MASKIRTALLSTAVASGLLLSNAPAYAAPLVEDSAALETKTETEEQSQSVAPALDAPAVEAPASSVPVQNPESAPQPIQPVAPVDDSLQQDAPPAGAIDDAVEEVPAAAEDSENAANTVVSTESAPTSEEPDQVAQPSTDEGLTQGAESSDEQSAGESDEVVAGLANTDAAKISADHEGSLDPAISESPGAKTAESSDEPDDGTESGSDAEIDALLAFDELFELIEMPPGSENWTEEQWLAFMDTEEGQELTEAVLDFLLQTEEFATILEIVDNFILEGDEVHLEDLKLYLLDLFGGNEEWAMEAYNGMMEGLRAEGFDVADWTNGPAETTPPVVPSEKPKPETKPEIKPAGNIKPVVDKKPIVEAVVKPVVQVKQNQLAETGANGTLLMGGAGVLLIGGGVLALGARRKARKH